MTTTTTTTTTTGCHGFLSWIAFHEEKDAHLPVTKAMDEAVCHPLFYTSTSECHQEKDAWQIVHDASLRKSNIML
jgi:hypothetical protein